MGVQSTLEIMFKGVFSSNFAFLKNIHIIKHICYNIKQNILFGKMFIPTALVGFPDGS